MKEPATGSLDEVNPGAMQQPVKAPFYKMTTDTLWDILSFLPPCAQLGARNACWALRRGVRGHFDAMATLTPGDVPVGPRGRWVLAVGLPLFRQLRALHLAGLRDQMDDVTCALLGFIVPPTVESVDVSSCPSVTNLGIYLLTRGALKTSLKYLDLTFTGTDYSIALHLYQLCPNVLIRRQPKWLDGHFQCPWNE
eukprot:EG_transcript_31225